MHVTRTNWENDDFIRFGKFFGATNPSSLEVTLDAAPDPASINTKTMIVTLEASVTIQAVSAKVSFILDGVVDTVGKVIRWTRLREIDQSASNGRVRVVLKGHAIVSKQGGLHLDGRALGKLDPATSGIRLVLPSSSGAQASDFESWFNLVPSDVLESLTVTPQSVEQENPVILRIKLVEPAMSDVPVELFAGGVPFGEPVKIPSGQEFKEVNFRAPSLGSGSGFGVKIKYEAKLKDGQTAAAFLMVLP